MPIILYACAAPNGAQLSRHRIASMTYQDGRMFVMVSSYATDTAEAPAYQQEYEAPLAALSADPEGSVTAWLASDAGPYPNAPIIADEAVDLEAARSRTLAAIRRQRDTAEWSGCETPLGRVDTDPSSQRKISGAVTMAMILGEAFTIDWRMADNTVAPHNSAAMIQMGLLVGQHISTCQNRKNELDAEAVSAETIEALEAIDIGAGWP